MRTPRALPPLLAITLTLASPTPLSAADAVRARYLMGTLCEVTLADAAAEAGWVDAAFAEIARLEDLFSLYKPESELSRLNRAPVGTAVRPSPELLDLARTADGFRARTGGAFDATLEPALALFRRGTWTDAEWTAALGQVGADGWAIDATSGTLTRRREGAGLNFDGIAKGRALDAAADALRRGGARTFQINFGGQVLAAGDKAWPIQLARPGGGAPLATIALSSGSLSTSAQSERFVERDGRRWGHIIDPRNGSPVQWAGSVTVLASDGTTADALSTALLVMGPAEGLRWIDEHFDEASALFAEPAERGWRLLPSRRFPIKTLTPASGARVQLDRRKT